MPLILAYIIRDEEVSVLSTFLQNIQQECVSGYRGSESSMPTQMARLSYGSGIQASNMLKLQLRVVNGEVHFLEVSCHADLTPISHETAFEPDYRRPRFRKLEPPAYHWIQDR